MQSSNLIPLDKGNDTTLSFTRFFSLKVILYFIALVFYSKNTKTQSAVQKSNVSKDSLLLNKHITSLLNMRFFFFL